MAAAAVAAPAAAASVPSPAGLPPSRPAAALAPSSSLPGPGAAFASSLCFSSGRTPR